MKEGAFSAIVAHVQFESVEDPDSCGSYYEDYTPALAQWIEAGYPDSPGARGCKVTICADLDWEVQS